MAEVEVQLDAYVIPDDHGVWKCFPGQTYRFYEVVRDSNAVFLDVRGLDALPANPVEWEDREALKIIAADRWTRELARQQRGGKGVNGAPDVSRQDWKVLNFLKGLLLHAKKDDLIIVPADGYRRDVLIGEVLDDPGEPLIYEAKDGDGSYSYVGRRVRWRARQEKREFTRDVIDSLHSQAAFHTIKRSLREEIYALAYENFILGDLYVATFRTSKEQFTTSDSAVVSVWFNALAAVYAANEEGHPHSVANQSFSELGLLRSNEAETGELAIDIASPGSVLLQTTGVFALAVMALFPLMQLDAATIAQQPVVVRIHTVGSATDQCALQVSKAVNEIADTLAVRRLQEACKVGTRAREEATLHTKARLKSQPEKHK